MEFWAIDIISYFLKEENSPTTKTALVVGYKDGQEVLHHFLYGFRAEAYTCARSFNREDTEHRSSMRRRFFLGKVASGICTELAQSQRLTTTIVAIVKTRCNTRFDLWCLQLHVMSQKEVEQELNMAFSAFVICHRRAGLARSPNTVWDQEKTVVVFNGVQPFPPKGTSSLAN